MTEVVTVASYQKVKGKTPNGGAYSEIYFFDEDGNIVDETKAVRCVIRECSEQGELITETWGTV
jgi:hypothetical protein